MRRPVLGLVLFAVSAFPALAEKTIFKDTGRWLVTYDSEARACRLEPKDESAHLVFTRTVDGREALLIPDPDGSGDGEKRSMTVLTGDRRWNAILASGWDNGAPVLSMNAPLANFRDALAAAGKLSVNLGGRRLGPFKANGLAASYPLLEECTVAAAEFKLEQTAAQEPDAYLGQGMALDWKVEALPVTYSYTDEAEQQWTARLAVSEQSGTTPKTVTMTVSRNGLKAVSTSIDVEYNAPQGSIGVYQFDHGLPAFVISNYTRGAHCCMVAKAVSYDGSKLLAADFGEFDGSSLTIRDIDGDGTDELDSVDQRFLYAFDSYAGSLAPVKIMKLRAGKLEDVSEDTAYQQYILRDMHSRAGDCYSEAGPGICAGVLANAARLGLFHSMLAYVPFDRIDGRTDMSYLSCSADECGEEKRFASFQEALEFRLQLWGYNTMSSLDDAGRSYFEPLVAHRKGFGGEGDESENGCSLGPTVFSFAPDKSYVRVAGYEYSCRIERTSILGQSAMGFGLCDAEGESYAAWLMFEQAGDDLVMSSVAGTSIVPAPQPTRMRLCR
ncbi:hypothetical protein [Rhizobium alvei]|uniref:Uncharacterized protein n=1 Tax=Rhizobium alvei TaxID=1132659 RepID=A0ABT8YIW7_9HYPH|nr:hypothetical protein [Rhizobium alvei]MDO6963190.1 hypothetical protein [Rhizobium alvei]